MRGKKFIPTEKERKEVEALASRGVTHDDIALLVRDGIDADTLKKWFKKELALGRAKANAQIGGKLFSKAMGEGKDAVTCLIFWAKTQMGWKETVRNEHSGIDGASLAPMTLAQFYAEEPKKKSKNK